MKSGDKKTLELGTIIYQKTFEPDNTSVNRLREFLGVEGIWVMLCKNDSDDTYEFLNVGKSKDIGKELIYDVSCLHFLSYDDSAGDKQYYNQFAEDVGIRYTRGYTQECVYPHIRKNYNTIVFMYVYDKSNSDIEKKIAWITKAKYWRGSHPFQQPQNDYYIKNRKKYFQGEDCFHTVEDLGKIMKELNSYGIGITKKHGRT